ncbi:serine/arginine repetitive matrix protein 1-like isoform X2 [Zingiber officinale]|uniref:serine/arginine repetitive matrix protein 1-like isoform X2 n=1 Tax=Zingiber officinale TaxID=94328 RepID=UPI001C4CC434|nr:serine/arginine repetitive matrix protein 1-like isoform X2 [Zingiber officinale]
MSGGFFRGTSAEQDTRFSNKQAKLLKSQKFPLELEHPVDMTKVKMDVIKPWIATRVTELLGFEDEVLINFVYGLLDGKGVDGKQIQIQLTGFLEKNTGKFMKELWGLLLSAQDNASGVPQQFLDAKQEEMRKRKVESDMITQEIQKRKEREGREFEQEKQKRLDVEAGNSRSANAISGSSSRHSQSKDSRLQLEERGTEIEKSPVVKRREGRSRSASVSSQSRSRSPSKQYHSPPRNSISLERRYKSPARRSISPRHRYSPRNNRSPPRHISHYARQRSPSTPRHGSPLSGRKYLYGRRSPLSLRHRSPPSRRRSPIQNRRRSPSPRRRWDSPSPRLRRDSPSPERCRRSPSPGYRRRSPSPIRRKRSPLPARRGSPSLAHRRRTSPPRRRISPSPSHHRRSPPSRHRRSPSPSRQRRSPSPVRHMSPVRRRSSPPQQYRSLSPKRLSSDPSRQGQGRSPRGYGANAQLSQPSRKSPNRNHRGSIREIDSRTNGFDTRRLEDDYASKRAGEGRSSSHTASHKVLDEHTGSKRNIPDRILRKLPGSSKSPSQDSRDQIDIDDDDDHRMLPENSSRRSVSPSNSRRTNLRSNRLSEDATTKQFDKRMPHDSMGINNDKEKADVIREDAYHDINSTSKKGIQSHPSNVKSKSDDEWNSGVDISRRNVSQVLQSQIGIEYGPQRGVRGEKHSSGDRQSLTLSPSDAEMQPKTRHYKEETDEHKHRSSEKKRHKRSDKHKRDSDNTSHSDSDIEDKKEIKRRRKDERRLRKEEKRRRRQERHHKRLERHSEKHKTKIADTVTPPSDFEKDCNDDGAASIKGHYSSDNAFETESEEKQLEIELRKKALESLRARKAVRH